jgi:N-methylhydantoinase B
VNQSNAKIAPIEIIESEFPTRILRFELIPDSGGVGAFRGGLGIRREYVNLQDARFSIRSTKHVIAPNGAADGGKGRTGDIVVNAGRESEKRLPTRYADYPLRAQDVFCLDTPGGGGLGAPLTRDPQRVASDVNEGYVTPEAARASYGVALVRKGRKYEVDAAATEQLRKEIARAS